MEVTSLDTTIVVHCKYILTLIFYFWIYFIYSVNPVIGASYPKLMNLLKSVKKQNSTSNPFRLCVHQSRVLVGTIEYRWNHFSHYFALEGVKIFSPSHCIGWTVFNSENGLRTICESSSQSKILSVCLAHKASTYYYSVWGLWVRFNGNLRIGQGLHCQLRNYTFLTDSWDQLVDVKMGWN